MKGSSAGPGSLSHLWLSQDLPSVDQVAQKEEEWKEERRESGNSLKRLCLKKPR